MTGAEKTYMEIVTSILSALRMAFAMFWEILWALILGFSLSAVVQAVVLKSEMSRLLRDDSRKRFAFIAAQGPTERGSECPSPSSSPPLF